MWSLSHESVADCMVECTSKGWAFGRTSRLGEMPVMKGPYTSINSVALIAGKRGAAQQLPA